MFKHRKTRLLIFNVKKLLDNFSVSDRGEKFILKSVSIVDEIKPKFLLDSDGKISL